MTVFDLILDPSEVAVNRSELALNNAPITVDFAGVDWGDAAISEFLADGRYGSIPVGRRWPNRIITIPLIVKDVASMSLFLAAKDQLMQKVGDIQINGKGWFKRQDGLYADVVGATLTFPDKYGELFGFEIGVVLALECLPDFYGDEVTLDSKTATGATAFVLQQTSAQAVVAGALPARTRIKVTETSANDQNGLVWGVRSEYYDSASTAACLLEAETLTMINGSSAHAHSGASGGTAVINSQLAGQQWMSVLVTDVASGSHQLTHRGSYRVVARSYSATATPKLRLLWGPGKAATFITNNETDQLPASAAFYKMDLGVIRIDQPAIGASTWRGVIQAFAQNALDPIEIDKLELIPVAESSGSLATGPVTPASSITVVATPTAAANSGSGTAWTTSAPYTAALSSTTSQLLKLSGFGFALPGSATVVGVTAAISRQQGGPGSIADTTIELLKAGTAAGSNKASATAWPTSPTVASYGGASDLWGTTISSTDTNNSGFGIEISATGSGSAKIASVTLTVAYVLGTAFGSTANRVNYASETLEVRTDGAWHTTDGTVYSEIVPEDGDLPRLPPSGFEDRAVELVMSTSRGNLISLLGDSSDLADSALDGFTVQVIYRPTWIFAP